MFFVTYHKINSPKKIIARFFSAEAATAFCNNIMKKGYLPDEINHA